MKQSRKAVRDRLAKTAFVAADAEPHLREAFEALCWEHGVPVTIVGSMKELGVAAGIEVGCAAMVDLSD